MKQYNYKCVVAKNGTKMYYKRVSGKWKRISNTCGKNAEKGKKKYRPNGNNNNNNKKELSDIYKIFGLGDEIGKHLDPQTKGNLYLTNKDFKKSIDVKIKKDCGDNAFGIGPNYFVVRPGKECIQRNALIEMVRGLNGKPRDVKLKSPITRQLLDMEKVAEYLANDLFIINSGIKWRIFKAERMLRKSIIPLISDGYKYFAKALETNNTLINLDLSESEIGRKINDKYENLKYLTKALEKNNTIKDLTLRRCKIDNKGAKFIAKMLEKNKTLKYLDISDNRIGDDGAILIARALENNTTLDILNIDGNIIGNNGAIAFAKMLEKNKTFKYFDISDNRIGDDGAKAFINPLEKLHHLRLEIEYQGPNNEISQNIIKEITELNDKNDESDDEE